ncbi:MAG: hypothetical protein Q4E75_00975 [bacterium]|nr:hypothetical protein [bacterium]
MENIKMNILHQDLCNILREEFKDTYNIEEDLEKISISIKCINYNFFATRKVSTKIGGHSATIQDSLNEKDIEEIVQQSIQYDPYSIEKIRIIGRYDRINPYKFKEYEYAYKGAEVTLALNNKKTQNELDTKVECVKESKEKQPKVRKLIKKKDNH